MPVDAHAAAVSPAQASVTVAAGLRWAREPLRWSGSPALDAQLLLGHVLGKGRAWLLAHGDAELTADQWRAFCSLVERRGLGEPVAYLLGRVFWRDLELVVGPGVLVPRPETEHVVDAAVDVAKSRGARVVVDVGTGSGALAVAIARELPQTDVMGLDISEDALAIARTNVERYGLAGRVTLRQGDLLDPLRTEPDLLVANLPYLSREQMETLPREVRFEPSGALNGGPNGTEVYERLLHALSERGWEPNLVLEIDPGQCDSIVMLCSGTWPAARVRLLPDLAGRTRVAVCEQLRGPNS